MQDEKKENLLGKKKKNRFFQLGKCEQVLLYFKFIQIQKKDQQ
jgi:hypothetical protein